MCTKIFLTSLRERWDNIHLVLRLFASLQITGAADTESCTYLYDSVMVSAYGVINQGYS